MRLLATLALLPSIALAGIIDITDQQVAGAVTTPTGVVNFTPLPADLILWGTNADFTNQSPAGIEADLETVIGQDLLLTGAVEGLTGTAITIPFAASMYYLHYGDNGIAFGYNAPVPTSFSITGLPNDLSNYRLYALDIVGDITSVEAPGHLALIGFGLAALGLKRRGRK